MTGLRWAGGRTGSGLPIRRQHAFLAGYRRSLCKKRYATDDLMDDAGALPVCVACSREAARRGLSVPAAA